MSYYSVLKYKIPVRCCFTFNIWAPRIKTKWHIDVNCKHKHVHVLMWLLKISLSIRINANSLLHFCSHSNGSNMLNSIKLQPYLPSTSFNIYLIGNMCTWTIFIVQNIFQLLLSFVSFGKTLQRVKCDNHSLDSHISIEILNDFNNSCIISSQSLFSFRNKFSTCETSRWITSWICIHEPFFLSPLPFSSSSSSVSII